jgi:hypothetical protein
MQVLVADGEWKLGPAYRHDFGPRNGRARARIYHFRRDHGLAALGCLPHPIRITMVTIRPNETRLAEKRADIPARSM